MKKLFTILMLFCSVVAWGQNEDGRKILEWAEYGDPDAQCWVGENYYLGSYDFPKDERLAFQWFEKSARQGNIDAIYYLGRCYLFGEGVGEDEKKGIEFYHKAAAKNHSTAMWDLAYRYKESFYNKNLEEAKYWFKKYMDFWFNFKGEETEGAAKHLRELGVYYHPGENPSNKVGSIIWDNSIRNMHDFMHYYSNPDHNGDFFINNRPGSSTSSVSSSSSSSSSKKTIALSDGSTDITGEFFTSGKTHYVKSYTSMLNLSSPTYYNKGECKIRVSGNKVYKTTKGVESLAYLVGNEYVTFKPISHFSDGTVEVPGYKKFTANNVFTGYVRVVRMNDGKVILYDCLTSGNKTALSGMYEIY